MKMDASCDTPRVRACKVCGGKSKHVFSLNNEYGEPHVLDIFSCASCGLLFVGNQTTEQQLADAYGAFDFEQYYREIADTNDRKVRRAVDDVALLLRGYPKKPSVLDVGCGYGYFLEALAKSHPSIRGAGHELPGDSATRCQRKGFEVFTCSLGKIPERFSLVALLDVAEHVPWPNATFAACFSLLKKNGYICVHTPRRCFWDSLFLALVRVPGLRGLSKAWLSPRVSIFHLHLWTDKALRLSLQKAGFRLVRLKAEMELSWPLERYAEVYLGDRLHLPPLLVRVVTCFARIVFVWLGTLKNKAICVAQKKEGD